MTKQVYLQVGCHICFVKSICPFCFSPSPGHKKRWIWATYPFILYDSVCISFLIQCCNSLVFGCTHTLNPPFKNISALGHSIPNGFGKVGFPLCHHFEMKLTRVDKCPS